MEVEILMQALEMLNATGGMTLPLFLIVAILGWRTMHAHFKKVERYQKKTADETEEIKKLLIEIKKDTTKTLTIVERQK